MTELAGLTVNAEQLAMLFKVARPTVYVWAKEHGMPKRGRGQYPLVECVQWRTQQLVDLASGKSGVEDERRQLVIAQRRRIELETAQARSELLPAGEVDTLINELAVIFASQLEGLPARLAHRLATVDDPRVIQSTLADECRAIRSATGAAVENFAGAHGMREDSDPAARKARRRVG